MGNRNSVHPVIHALWLTVLGSVTHAFALDHAPILAHIGDRHPDASAESEKTFWNDTVGTEGAELRKWQESERDPHVRLRLLQGITWLADSESKAWVRDRATTAPDSSQQLAIVMGLGLNQGDEAVPVLEKLATKAKSVSVKREVRRAYGRILARNASDGAVAGPLPEWVRSLPEPEHESDRSAEPNAHELISRPGAGGVPRAAVFQFPGKLTWNGRALVLSATGVLNEVDVEVNDKSFRLKLLLPGKPSVEAEWRVQDASSKGGKASRDARDPGDSAIALELECAKSQLDLGCEIGKTHTLKVIRLSSGSPWVRLEWVDRGRSGVGLVRNKGSAPAISSAVVLPEEKK